MKISDIKVLPEWVLQISAADGRVGRFDVRPYLDYEIFQPLRDHAEFAKITNGGYFVEWDCGADLSADTIEARWELLGQAAFQS